MSGFLLWLRQRWCDHRIGVDKLQRITPDLVVCPCNRCGNVLSAAYGLALHAKWEAAPPMAQWETPPLWVLPSRPSTRVETSARKR